MDGRNRGSCRLLEPPALPRLVESTNGEVGLSRASSAVRCPCSSAAVEARTSRSNCRNETATGGKERCGTSQRCGNIVGSSCRQSCPDGARMVPGKSHRSQCSSMHRSIVRQGGLVIACLAALLPYLLLLYGLPAPVAAIDVAWTKYSDMWLSFSLTGARLVWGGC